ncbi:MAG: class I SAM-dependent methyltransferase [Acidobacteriota bacterium]
MTDEPWQLRLVKKSIKKKDKLRLLEASVPVRPSRVALDLGCAQGILSYFARRRGGFWVSADEDLANLRTAKKLLRENLVQLTGESLPFSDASFDLVLCLDYLEHVERDHLVISEISRVLKKGAELILVTPQTGRFFLLHKLRSALGLGLEYFGHKREGYSLPGLEAKLSRVHLRIERKATYSRFFSEFFELALNFAYIKILARVPAAPLRDGHIRPSTSEEFRAQDKPFALYSLVYPFVWLLSRLDTLIFFQKGYSLMVWARKL